MREPYKVMVWGPGGLGTVAIWEILQSPAFSLVGVRAYSEDKHGKDVGDLFGIRPTGIKLSCNAAKLLQTDCDCIVMTARDMGNFNTDEEILQILAAGRNIVTPLPYQNAHLFRGRDFMDKLEAACRKGRSVFHATGIDPDVVSDRVVPGLTGMCTDISSLTLQENWDSTYTAAELLGMCGFGRPPEEAQRIPVAAAISTNFLHAIGRSMEHTLGVKYDRVEETHEFFPASRDIDSVNVRIKAGTVGRVTHRFRGFIDDKGRQPFFTVEYNWVIGDEMLPEGVRPGEKWIVTIEGRPSMRMVVNLRASNGSNDRTYALGRFNSEPGYHGTIAPCLQAIPLICAAQPGVMPSLGPPLHWSSDYRNLAPFGERRPT
jgi:4-hydroxy-tetrahydrodipicolinate reductase